jgi:hypothetical protein
MGLIPSNRPLSDGQIRECWFRALRWNGTGGSLARKLALATCDELEAAGVDEEGIDRALAAAAGEAAAAGRAARRRAERADLARHALHDYREREGEAETARLARELLADLRLLCAEEGIDFGLLCTESLPLSQGRPG